ncbi:hypothetical protein BDZ89DRAFT_1068917 [Hymenopellis radicata]|nr:hypothetical protein BDZ89DRAFT_1068917 [Hymenopellis radicata]
MTTRKSFAVEAIAFAVFCLFSSLVVKPSFPRWIFFVGTLSTLYLYTTTAGSAVVDGVLAVAYMWFLLNASDLILLSNPQRDFRWIRQKEVHIENASLTERVKWALRLLSSPRGVGWNFQPKGRVLRPRPAPGTSRASFLVNQTGIFLLRVLIIDMCGLYIRHSPMSPTNGISFTERIWYWRLIDLSIWVAQVQAGLAIVHSIVCLVSVALHLSRPEDWSEWFGSWTDAYTIRRVWGRVWHQWLRKIFYDHSKFVTERVLGLKPETPVSSFVQLYIAFFFSGSMHSLCDSMGGGRFEDSRGFLFFNLQALGIVVEEGVIAAGRGLGIKRGHPIFYIVGYVWVVAWFSVLLPMWWDPMLRAGFWDQKITIFPPEWYERAAKLVGERVALSF